MSSGGRGGAHLAAPSVFESSLPDSWRSLVQAVSELGALAEAGSKEDLEARRAEAEPIHRRILEAAAPRIESAPPPLCWGSETHRRWFTEAVLLWTRFADSCGRIRIDMLGSQTLGRFPIDFDPAPGERERMRDAAAAAFGWSEEELGRIEGTLEHRLSNLAVKQGITSVVARWMRQVDEEAAVRLFRRVFGDVPLRTGDVELVVTQTTLFFCLPFEGSVLTRPGFGDRAATERAAVASFLDRVTSAAASIKSVRFPAFGLYDQAAVDRSLYRELAAALSADAPELAGVDERVVAATFATMVVVVAAEEAEKYLIHDSWGHGWQESLCEFEWLFHDLGELSAPVPAAIASAEGEELAAGLEADLRRRITIGLNLVMAECLADLIEHKFVRQRGPLPSSSLIPEAVLKLDLSWLDATRIARLWSEPYRGLPEPAQRLAEERFGAALVHASKSKEPVGRVAVDLVQRTVLGVATLEAALARLLARGDERYAEMTDAARAAGHTAPPRWWCPAACIDLIALMVGWFYDQDPALHIWHLDELVARELWPALVELERTLARP